MEIDALVWERNGGVDGGRVRTRTWDEFHGLRDDLGIICVPIGAKPWCARSKLRAISDGMQTSGFVQLRQREGLGLDAVTVPESSIICDARPASSRPYAPDTERGSGSRKALFITNSPAKLRHLTSPRLFLFPNKKLLVQRC